MPETIGAACRRLIDVWVVELQSMLADERIEEALTFSLELHFQIQSLCLREEAKRAQEGNDEDCTVRE